MVDPGIFKCLMLLFLVGTNEASLEKSNISKYRYDPDSATFILPDLAASANAL